MEDIRTDFMNKYLSEVKESKDWNEYEKHKRHIKDVAGGDVEMYTWAIRELTERMKI